MNSYNHKKKWTLTIVFMILLLLANIFFVYNVVTKADTVNGVVYIKANYSSDITPQSGDKFVITYKKTNGKQTAKIELDASTISEQYAPMNLPINSYTITSISYQGSNTQITSEGYGIVTDFSSRSENEDIIYMAIGKEQTSIMEREYANVIVMDTNHDKNGQIVDLPETTSPFITTPSISETTVQETTITETTVEGEQNTVNEEPSVEDYNKNDNNKDSGIFGRLIPVALIFIIVLIVLYVLHKKGKI